MRLAQHRLVHLVDARKRKRAGPQLEAPRALESRDMVAAMRHQLLELEPVAGTQHHHGMHRLAPGLMRHADDGALRYGGMAMDRIFHLDAVDVLAAGHD